jgi:hypothetical protein
VLTVTHDPPTERAWEHSTLGGGSWRRHASVLPRNCASSTLSSGPFWSMAWRFGARLRSLSRENASGVSRTPPPPPFLHFDQLLLTACRLACGIRGLPGEPGWTRRACVSSEVILAVCQVLPSECACDLAHLRYSERLRSASRRLCDPSTLHFRAAARAGAGTEKNRNQRHTLKYIQCFKEKNQPASPDQHHEATPPIKQRHRRPLPGTLQARTLASMHT